VALGDERRAFTRKLCELVIWVEDNLGVKVALDEVTVHSPRAARLGVQRVVVEDAVHIPASFHHVGKAADLLVYRDSDADGEVDDYIKDGKDPIWLKIAMKWESMDPKCVSGIRWRDPNHVSWGEGSKEEPLEELWKVR
jgi:hypothetical protein